MAERNGMCEGGGFYTGNNQNQGEKDDLYKELWHACAGPHVYVPCSGERVFYFPQGHIEQVEAYAQQDAPTEMPAYNLPFKILCRVISVNLKAEPHTDEVFAQVVLLPETKQDQLASMNDSVRPSRVRANVISFRKILTPSDTGTHGGFSVPKRHADECFPPLNMSQQPPAQELIAKDLNGFEWRFRHIYRGQPKRHLLTSGWSTFVNSKKLVSGDSCIFIRGENGELRVGITRAMKQQNIASASIISGQSMQHGILASASHAISTGTIFTVYYHPWTSPSKFIIPFDQYMKSIELEYSTRMKFRMPIEDKDGARKRFAGTIVDIEDIDGARWPHSEWRCLRVQWDSPLDTSMNPERVSPWSIEPLESSNKKHTPLLPRLKRARSLEPTCPALFNLAKDGVSLHSRKHPPQWCTNEEVFQGQEYKNIGSGNNAQRPAPACHSQIGVFNPLHFLMHDTSGQYPGSPMSFSDGSISTPGPPIPTTQGLCDDVIESRNFSISNTNGSDSWSLECGASASRDENEAPPQQSDGSSPCRLFGVTIVNSHSELPSPQVATFSKNLSPLPISHLRVSGIIQDSEKSNRVSGVMPEEECKKHCFFTSRGCKKVLKYGTALGRSIDLSCFDGYNELISKLDQMFTFEGSLIDGSSGWHIMYAGNDVDKMMAIGDCPWQDFQSMVQRIFIYPREELDKLNLSSQDAISV